MPVRSPYTHYKQKCLYFVRLVCSLYNVYTTKKINISNSWLMYLVSLQTEARSCAQRGNFCFVTLVLLFFFFLFFFCLTERPRIPCAEERVGDMCG